MQINLSILGALFRTEMRMVLRDRRMLFASILLPLLVTPLLFAGSSWSLKHHQKQLREMDYLYSIAGPNPEPLRSLLKIQPPKGTNQPPSFRAREIFSKDPKAALERGDIQVIFEMAAATPAETGNTAQASQAFEADGEKPRNGAPVVTLTFRADRQESSTAVARFTERLREARLRERARILVQHGFSGNPDDLAAIREVDLASTRQVAGLALGRMLTLLLLVFILSSGAVVAIDSLAGEKERGTLETLLTTAAGRIEIYTAKQLVIIAVALVITTIQLANLLIYLHFKLLPVPANFAAAMSLPKILLLLFMYLPIGALAANVLLLVSGYARSYKEAQMYFVPLLLVGLVPAVAPCLPGIELRSAIVLAPVANIAVAAREILIGNLDWPMMAVSWLLTSLAALWTGRIGLRSVLQEKFILATETDAAEFLGGAALFEKRVLRWFAVLWGALLIINSYTDHLDLRLQISINLVGLFFSASLAMVWRYKLNPREAFSLRAPPPAAWLGVLVGVPGGFITALALFELANRFIPAPSGITEAFTGALFPPHVPFYQVLFFLTVMPAVFEELTFRGALLYGLRRKLHPALAVIVVGLIFGVFHFALFRLVPTACLGMLFAIVTLLTRSIFPAVLWHCLSNGIGLLAFKFKLPESDLGAASYLAGAGLLALAFWIFWRHRARAGNAEADAGAELR